MVYIETLSTHGKHCIKLTPHAVWIRDNSGTGVKLGTWSNEYKTEWVLNSTLQVPNWTLVPIFVNFIFISVIYFISIFYYDDQSASTHVLYMFVIIYIYISFNIFQ